MESFSSISQFPTLETENWARVHLKAGTPLKHLHIPLTSFDTGLSAVFQNLSSAFALMDYSSAANRIRKFMHEIQKKEYFLK